MVTEPRTEPKVQVHMRLPESVVAWIDEQARDQYAERSAIVVQLVWRQWRLEKERERAKRRQASVPASSPATAPSRPSATVTETRQLAVEPALAGYVKPGGPYLPGRKPSRAERRHPSAGRPGSSERPSEALNGRQDTR